MAVSQSVAARRARRLAKKSNGDAQQMMPGSADAGMIPHQSIPQQAITDPPAPGISDASAAGGEPLVRGSSTLQPMTPQGHATTRKAGAEMAALGGPDTIIPSDARRAQETAQEVSGQTGAPIQQPQPGLESHAMGVAEGEPKTPELKRFLAKLMKDSPNASLPGQGAMTTRPGESFNAFRTRALSAVRGLMQKLASDPRQRILVPTSTQVIKLVKAWIAAGTPDDFSVDHRPMLKDDGGKPGDIERFFPAPSGKWEMTPFAPRSANDMQGGIYFMRHGETSSIQAQNASAGQKARAQLIAHVRSGNYVKARHVATNAHSAGHLSDEDISSAIDEALPTANDAGRLRPDQLLDAFGAGGPAKRQELLPVLQQRFANLGTLPPDGQNRLRAHLGRMGVRLPA